MNNGIYEYEPCENAYDIGMLVVEVKETEKALQLKVVKRDMRFSTYVDVLFGDKDKANINKRRSPHALVYGSNFFIVYPNRMGQPLLFAKKEGAE